MMKRQNIELRLGMVPEKCYEGIQSSQKERKYGQKDSNCFKQCKFLEDKEGEIFKEEGKVNNISPLEQLNKMRTKKKCYYI